MIMPVKKTTVKQKVYNAILFDILDGNFALDEFLTEKQLGERYDIGKAPVREALIELCNENILQSIPRLGYQIIQVTDRNVADATELRLDLEISALRKAQNRFDDSMLSKISKLNQDWWQEVLSGELDIKSRWHHNSLFHTTLVSFGGNELCVDIVCKLIQLEWRAYAQMLSSPEQRNSFFHQSTNKPHLEIERALSARDFSQSEALLRKDILTLSELLRSQSRLLL